MYKPLRANYNFELTLLPNMIELNRLWSFRRNCSIFLWTEYKCPFWIGNMVVAAHSQRCILKN